MPRKPRAGKRTRVNTPWAEWLRTEFWNAEYFMGGSAVQERVRAFLRKRKVRSALIKYINNHEDLRPAIVAARSAGDAAMYEFLDTILPMLPKRLRRHRRKKGLNRGTQETPQEDQDREGADSAL